MHVAFASKEKPNLPSSGFGVFWPRWLNIIFIDIFLHIFAGDAILSATFRLKKASPMAEIHPRLKVRIDQPDQRSLGGHSQGALESSIEASDKDIPIFCAGGCGEVMGYVQTDDSIPTQWCPLCESARASECAIVEPVPSDTDELAELRSPPKDLRKTHFVQVLAVGLIFAGSVYIALGQAIGIYLAAIGTVAWIAVAFVLWRLKD